MPELKKGFFLSSSSADTLRSFFLATSFRRRLFRSHARSLLFSLSLILSLSSLSLSLYLSLSAFLAVIRARRYFSANFADSLPRRFLPPRWMCDAFLNSIPNIPRRLWRAMTPRGENARRVVPVKARSRPRRARAPIEQNVSSLHSRPLFSLSLDRSRSPTPDPFALTSGDFPASSFHFSYSRTVLRISSSSTFFAAALSICS